MPLEDHDRGHAQCAGRLLSHVCRCHAFAYSSHSPRDNMSELPMFACYHLLQDKMHPNLHDETSHDAGHDASWLNPARDRPSDVQTLIVGLGSDCTDGATLATDGESLPSAQLSRSNDDRDVVLSDLRPAISTCDSHLLSSGSGAVNEVVAQHFQCSSEESQDQR